MHRAESGEKEKEKDGKSENIGLILNQMFYIWKEITKEAV